MKNAPSDQEEAKGQHRAIVLSSSRSDSAGIGTAIVEFDTVSVAELATRSKWLPRLHRAGPSASLDKSIVRIRLWRNDSTGARNRQIGNGRGMRKDLGGLGFISQSPLSA